MKKTFLLLFVGFSLLFLFSPHAKAVALCQDPASPNVALPGFPNGLVPCGITYNADGKTLTCPCELGHFFVMAFRIYNFVVLAISIPLAAFLIVIGGVMFVISAGNPTLAEKGKSMIKYTLISLLIIFGSYLIVDVLLRAIGFNAIWNTF